MDTMNQRIAIIALAFLGMIGAGGSILLTLLNRPVPEPLTALCGVVVGCLATFAMGKSDNGKRIPLV